ncbi:Rieske (2Fe-2S) protein [Amycolatopsis nigrescens]|uniref:Rieske (2Fe-2S) protein n=1 Tax=Amycolatopsis nigrescens TaxID=381445 RepID=UPI000476F981|nr:Rieske (2Fe-2S) protein [Amycolatopsis nigrescens]
MTAEQHTRRTMLTTGATAAGAVAGLAVLSACASGDSGQQPAQSPSAPPAPAPAPGGALTALNDVPVGQAKSVTTPDGKPAIVTRTSETAVSCFSAACTHQGGTVAPEGAELKCPLHGSIFDATTGAVKKGPAKEPLPAIPVKVENGQVVTS